VVNSNTSTSLAGSANPINNSIAAGPNQGSLAYGNPGSASGGPQLLSNLVGVSRNVAPLIINHYNVQPVYDVYANIDRRDLGSVGDAVQKIVQGFVPKLPAAAPSKSAARSRPWRRLSIAWVSDDFRRGSSSTC